MSLPPGTTVAEINKLLMTSFLFTYRRMNFSFRKEAFAGACFLQWKRIPVENSPPELM